MIDPKIIKIVSTVRLDKTKIGQKIKKCRTMAGWTQEEAANVLGIDRSNYGHAERGAQMLTWEHIFKLKVAFLHVGVNFSIDDILFSEEQNRDLAIQDPIKKMEEALIETQKKNMRLTEQVKELTEITRKLLNLLGNDYQEN